MLLAPSPRTTRVRRIGLCAALILALIANAAPGFAQSTLEMDRARRQIDEAKQDPTKRRLLECMGVKVYADPQPVGSPPSKVECNALTDRLRLPRLEH